MQHPPILLEQHHQLLRRIHCEITRRNHQIVFHHRDRTPRIVSRRGHYGARPKDVRLIMHLTFIIAIAIPKVGPVE